MSTILEVQSPIMVDAHIKRWTITNDDIYLMKFKSTPPEWLQDIFDDIMYDSDLVQSIDDLEARFSNFEINSSTVG